MTRNLYINVYTTKEWVHIMKRSAVGIETIAYGAFRASYRSIVDSHRDRPFGLGRRGRPEVVVVPSELFEQLEDSRERLETMTQTMPLLLAAARAGVAFPSETLASLGYQVKFDEQKLHRFITELSVGPTHDEDGATLQLGDPPLDIEVVEEDDAELTEPADSNGPLVPTRA